MYFYFIFFHFDNRAGLALSRGRVGSLAPIILGLLYERILFRIVSFKSKVRLEQAYLVR